MKLDIKIKRLTGSAVIPRYGSAGAAGADLFADTADETVILPGETKMIHTGISMAIPEGYVGLVFARSGLSCKRDLAPANKVGVIDCDYRGEIIVALHNHGSEDRIIATGERIAQISIVPYLTASFSETDDLDSTDRGEGGFGSTGTK